MDSLRILLRRHALAAWLVIAAALLIKALLPAGFMPVRTANGIAVVLCPGMAPAAAHATAMSGMPGMAHPKGDERAPAKPDVPCAFAGLTAPAFGGADIVLLAIAFATVVTATLLFKPIVPIARRAFLRPPLRGPPARA